MLIFKDQDPITIPFNDWLKTKGLFIAIAIAATLIILVVTLYLLSIKKKR